MTNIIINNIIDDPDQYVKNILKGEFIDVQDGDNVFKGIQVRSNDELQQKMEKASGTSMKLSKFLWERKLRVIM